MHTQYVAPRAFKSVDFDNRSFSLACLTAPRLFDLRLEGARSQKRQHPILAHIIFYRTHWGMSMANRRVDAEGGRMVGQHR